DLRRRDAGGVPADPGLDRRRGALHVARGDREMAVLLRDLLDRHVEAVLLEQARFLGERERREAGPAGDADGDLGLLGVGEAGGERGHGQRDELLLHGWRSFRAEVEIRPDTRAPATPAGFARRAPASRPAPARWRPRCRAPGSGRSASPGSARARARAPTLARPSWRAA